MADDFANLSEDARAYLRKLHNDYTNVKKTDSGLAEQLMEKQRKESTRLKKSSSDYARSLAPTKTMKEKPKTSSQTKENSQNTSRGYSRVRDYKKSGPFRNDPVYKAMFGEPDKKESGNSAIRKLDPNSSQTTGRGYSSAGGEKSVRYGRSGTKGSNSFIAKNEPGPKKPSKSSSVYANRSKYSGNKNG